MFPFLRQHMRLWAIWILSSTALLFANPWVEFSWPEIAAVSGPLIMAIDRRLKRELALAIGLPAITLLLLVEPMSGTFARLLVDWTVFGGGVILAARTVDSHLELEAIAGHVAFAPPDGRAFALFKEALEREMGRARRHGRPFALLSAAAHPQSIRSQATGPFREELMRALAENRSRLELNELLLKELHVYSDVVAARERVLALVPEADVESMGVLIARIQKAAHERLDFELQIGAACFPRDAICVEELIAAADSDRTSTKLRSLPDQGPDSASHGAEELTPDMSV
jgi:hypothetical protein